MRDKRFSVRLLAAVAFVLGAHAQADGYSNLRQQGMRTYSTGTAFAVAREGVFATCAHVVRGAKSVKLRIGTTETAAEILAVDVRHDLAILKAVGTNVTPIPILDPGTVRVGQPVYALGYPLIGDLGTSLKQTQGSISGVEEAGGSDRILLDLLINPGNSGGPLVNSSGYIVGIVDAKLMGEGVSAVGIAVPSKYLVALLKAHGMQPMTVARGPKLDGETIYSRLSPKTLLVLAEQPANGLPPPAHPAERRNIPPPQPDERSGKPPAPPAQLPPGSPDYESIAEWRKLEGGSDVVRESAVAFAPDGKTFATVNGANGQDKKGTAWDLEKGVILSDLIYKDTRPLGNSDAIGATSCVFSNDGRCLATGGYSSRGPQHVILIWDTATWRVTSRLVGGKDESQASSLAFSPDSKHLLASGGIGDLGEVNVWNLATGTIERKLTGFSGKVVCVRVSSDGTKAMAASKDGTVRMWNLRTGDQLLKLDTGLSDRGWPLLSAAITKDASRIYACSSVGWVFAFDGNSGKELWRKLLDWHISGVGPMETSPDGLVLAIGVDNDIRFLLTSTGDPLPIHGRSPGYVTSLSFSPDGRMLAMTNPIKLIVWRIP